MLSRVFMSIILFLGFSFLLSNAQTVIKSSGEVKTFLIPETMTVLSEEDGNVKVLVDMSQNVTQKEYKNIDIKQNDVILMLNAKKVSSVENFEKIYSEITTGDEVKIGIKRGEEMRIVSFSKADPADKSQPRMMVMTTKVPDEGDGKEGSGDIIDPFTGERQKLVPELGVILQKKNDQITVQSIMDYAEEVVGSKSFTVSTRILSINGKKVTGLDDVPTILNDIPDNEPVVMEIANKGKTETLTFRKPKSPNKLIIKQ